MFYINYYKTFINNASIAKGYSVALVFTFPRESINAKVRRSNRRGGILFFDFYTLLIRTYSLFGGASWGIGSWCGRLGGGGWWKVEAKED